MRKKILAFAFAAALLVGMVTPALAANDSANGNVPGAADAADGTAGESFVDSADLPPTDGAGGTH